jgi:NADH:ubiquinone oxidoreductase subunit K
MYLISAILIIVGIINITVKINNYLLILISIELIIIGIIIGLIEMSINMDNGTGLIFGLYILIIGAIESAIGLSLIVLTKKYN